MFERQLWYNTTCTIYIPDIQNNIHTHTQYKNGCQFCNIIFSHWWGPRIGSKHLNQVTSSSSCEFWLVEFPNIIIHTQHSPQTCMLLGSIMHTLDNKWCYHILRRSILILSHHWDTVAPCSDISQGVCGGHTGVQSSWIHLDLGGLEGLARGSAGCTEGDTEPELSLCICSRVPGTQLDGDRGPLHWHHRHGWSEGEPEGGVEGEVGDKDDSWWYKQKGDGTWLLFSWHSVVCLLWWTMGGTPHTVMRYAPAGYTDYGATSQVNRCAKNFNS